ncbi:MAG TPA: hypothetical protein VMN57_16175 [Anaerolineales bacterium]|nr:hypothetical protein [Anaerolineales bacterium]
MRNPLQPVQRLGARVKHLLGTPAGIPIFLFIIGALVYGPFIPWLGFYWDDQAWIWYMNARGAGGALEIDASFRPLAGWVIRLGYALAGLDPRGWQIFNLALRCLAALGVWRLVAVIRPGRKTLAGLTAVFFLLYPGFSSQFASVNSSRHLFPAALLFLSLGLTGLAVRSRRNRARLTVGALATAVMTMLTTDYLYGLELVRGAVIWMVLSQNGEPMNLRARLRRLAAAWTPYLLAVGAFFSWRYALSRSINYHVSLLDELVEAPVPSLLANLAELWRGFHAATAASWLELFTMPDPALFGPRKMALWALVAGAGFFLTLIVFKAAPADKQGERRNPDMIILSLAALLVAGLPFIATNLVVRAAFPFDRLLLPYMFGGSLLLFALLDRVLPPRMLAWAGAVLIGLAAGRQTVFAGAFVQEWENQAAFFRQLAWRAPSIAPGTALLTEELPFDFSTDNSLTGPLNWVYAPEFNSGELPLIFLNLDIRLGGKVPALEPGIDLFIESYKSPFHGSTDRILVVYYDPPGCVRVLDPVYDSRLPGTGYLLDQALVLSRPGDLIFDTSPGAALPEEVYLNLTEDEHTWCYFFQRAELARQLEDWAMVAALGEEAFRLQDTPNRAAERLPFIEGYAHTGDWETAFALTEDTFTIDAATLELLCAAWERIDRGTPASPEKAGALERLEDLLDC